MTILEQITELLVAGFDLSRETVTPDARLESDLGINSLELAELALRCDEEFGVEIDDDDIHRLITVQDVANYIEEKQG